MAAGVSILKHFIFISLLIKLQLEEVRKHKSVLKCQVFCSSRFWGFHNSADEDSSLTGFYALSNCKQSLVFRRSWV